MTENLTSNNLALEPPTLLAITRYMFFCKSDFYFLISDLTQHKTCLSMVDKSMEFFLLFQKGTFIRLTDLHQNVQMESSFFFGLLKTTTFVIILGRYQQYQCPVWRYFFQGTKDKVSTLETSGI